jgi:hypothetical protein
VKLLAYLWEMNSGNRNFLDRNGIVGGDLVHSLRGSGENVGRGY